MRRLVFSIVALLCLYPMLSQAQKTNQLFDALKVYNEKSLVLNDFIEFSEFDISEIKIIDDQAAAVAQSLVSDANTPTNIAVTALSNGESEIRAVINRLPQSFYVGLKREIFRNRLPVTLYPKDSPGFANPLKLYVKIKKIHLYPPQPARDGGQKQPVELRIFVQMKDKDTDQILFKYYDSEATFFDLGKNQADGALAGAAQKMMRDLVFYLKPRY